MNVLLGNLPIGKWRNLTKTEWAVLKGTLNSAEL